MQLPSHNYIHLRTIYVISLEEIEYVLDEATEVKESEKGAAVDGGGGFEGTSVARKFRRDKSNRMWILSRLIPFSFSFTPSGELHLCVSLLLLRLQVSAYP